MSIHRTSLVAVVLIASACSDADLDATSDASSDASSDDAAHAQLMDAVVDGSLMRQVIDFGYSADRDHMAGIELAPIAADCGGKEMVFERARPDPVVQLDGRIEMMPALCAAPADSRRHSVLDLDLLVQLGDAQVGIEGQLECREVAPDLVECRPTDSGLFVELETDRITMAELSQDDAWTLGLFIDVADPDALVRKAAGCWLVQGTNGEPVEVCPVAL